MIIQFHPVIEDMIEVYRKVRPGEYYLELGDICHWQRTVNSTLKHFIYRRVDLEVDPIKEALDKFENNIYFEHEMAKAVLDYIKKVYGEEK